MAETGLNAFIRRIRLKLQRRFYRKSLTTILLVASIPGIVIGLGIFLLGRQQIESQMQQIHRQQLLQQADNINDQFSNLELSLTHWAFDPVFGNSLRNLDFTYGYQEVNDIYQTLLVMEGTNPLIDHVELYLDDPGHYLFTKERYTALSAAAASVYRQNLASDKMLFWTQSLGSKSTSGKGPLSLVFRIPGGSPNPFGVIVAYLNADKVAKMMKTLTPYEGGTTLLMDQNGDPMLTAPTGRAPGGLEAAMRDKVLKSKAPSGSFLANWGQDTYSVLYGQFERLGSPWTYASIAPLHAVLAPVLFISKLVLGISLLGLLLAIILSWFGSRRIYSPVERLVDQLNDQPDAASPLAADEFQLFERQWSNLNRESQTLQSRLEEQLPLVREGFLLQLVQGYLYSLSEQELRQRMQHYGWESGEDTFVALMIQLSGFSNLQGRFSEGDEDLVTFAAANIVEELARKGHLRYDVVNFHDLSLGLLLRVEPAADYGQWKQELLELCHECIDAIAHILKMHVTVSISQTASQVKQIPDLFQDVRDALSYRRLQDYNQIIDMESLQESGPNRELHYPFIPEREAIHALHAGARLETVRQIGLFLTELSQHDSTELYVQQGMLQLLGSMLNAMIKSGVNPYQLYEGTNLFDKLSQLREPGEMLNWFEHTLLEPYFTEWASRQDQYVQQIAEKVIEELQARYMTDISLDACAELVGMSPYALSKVFKQVTGWNFIDYLTHIRMGHAKELLAGTDMRIADIAEKVGYQPNYFNRIFKKSEGVTPSQYRELSVKS